MAGYMYLELMFSLEIEFRKLSIFVFRDRSLDEIFKGVSGDKKKEGPVAEPWGNLTFKGGDKRQPANGLNN